MFHITLTLENNIIKGWLILMKKEFTKKVVVEKGSISLVNSCYAKKTERLSELGFSVTSAGDVSYPACFEPKVTESNSAQVLYDCFTSYTEVVKTLYQTTGGFDSEMLGTFIFELVKVIFESHVHNAEVSEFLRKFIKKCIKFTLLMSREECIGEYNKKHYYKYWLTNLLDDVLTKYDYKGRLYYLDYEGFDGICSCRMSQGQIFITKALWRLANEFCNISELVDGCFYSMRLLRVYSYDLEVREFLKQSQKMEMTACYKEILDCIDTEFWISPC